MARSPDYNDKTDEAPVAAPQAPGAPVLEPNEARAGATHHNVRFVLAASLAGAIVVLIVAYALFFGGGGTPTQLPTG